MQGRAVHNELVTNATAAQAIAKGENIGPLSSAAWRALMPDVSRLLSEPEFTDIATAHLFTEKYEERRRAFLGGEGIGAPEREAFSAASQSYHEAAELLRRKVW